MKVQKISLFWDKRILFRAVAASLATFCLIFSLVLGVDAASDRRKDKGRRDVAEVEVKNFGKVNDHIYRGGQPDDDEYTQLSGLGIKTVIDLREDAEKFARRSAEDAGLQYVNLRLNSKRPPTAEEAKLFLTLVNDKTNWPVYVHCAGGRHRTGVLLAVYRMEIDGWDADRAYREMKDFKFYSSWGHGDMKDYVFDYYEKMNDRHARSAPGDRPRRVTGAGQDN
jgi:protein tyrosine phosphatase (PTP) superfamily phosphohydrolase (DUF442 family)